MHGLRGQWVLALSAILFGVMEIKNNPQFQGYLRGPLGAEELVSAVQTYMYNMYMTCAARSRYLCTICTYATRLAKNIYKRHGKSPLPARVQDMN